MLLVIIVQKVSTEGMDYIIIFNSCNSYLERYPFKMNSRGLIANSAKDQQKMVDRMV